LKRSEFLKEMSSSLGKTLKALYGPSVEEKADKLGNAADKFLRISWHYLIEMDGLKEGIEQRFFLDRPILIVYRERDVQVICGICPVCSNLLAFSSLYATGKCLICEKEYNFQTKLGNLEYKELPIKMEKGKIYLGMTRSKDARNGE
jgi:hypothetical protein